jgi:hypothetical protein
MVEKFKKILLTINKAVVNFKIQEGRTSNKISKRLFDWGTNCAT